MTCFVCGSRMKTKRENYRYDAVGLPGITLQGVEVSRCGKCGEYEVAIPRIEELHRSIAQAVISKKERLTPAEIRFLRKQLGWTGAEFAGHFGAARETVSRWENGSAPMGPTADRLLRLIVANPPAAASSVPGVLRPAAKSSPKPFRIGLKVANGEWKAKAA
jgi:putative zinc finger/helix-turn-helix YgiT family protein